MNAKDNMMEFIYTSASEGEKDGAEFIIYNRNIKPHCRMKLNRSDIEWLKDMTDKILSSWSEETFEKVKANLDKKDK